MIVAGTQDLIHQIAVVGQKDQPLRVFVQSTNREDALAVVNKVHNVIALAVFRCADNTDRFIEGDENQIFGLARLDQLTVDLHDIARVDLIANGRTLAIDKNIALFNVAIGFATRANSAFTDVFIESG